MKTLQLDNNEQVTRGIMPYKSTDGSTVYLAMTFTASKTFKTYRGAVAFLAKYGLDENGDYI